MLDHNCVNRFVPVSREQGLRQLIPSVHEKEKEMLKMELSVAQACSIIFDGSTHLGEALFITVRMFKKD